MPDAKDEPGTVVKPNEAALIVDASGDVRMSMPEYSDEEDVPYYVMVLSAVWIKIREDEKWAQNILEEVFGDDD